MIKPLLKYAISNILFRDKVIWHGNKNRDCVSLSFDDGPHPDYTLQVLESLQKIDASATFFVLGMNAEKNIDVIDEIVKQGHEIAIHTYSHLSMTKTDYDQYLQDIIRCENVLKSQNISASLFRPPYGDISWPKVPSLLSERKIVLWNKDTTDYLFNSFDEAWGTTDGLKIENGDIYLMHDVYAHTSELVLRLGEKIIKNGKNIVPVSKMMNWYD